jgi:hypothetical protein
MGEVTNRHVVWPALGRDRGRSSRHLPLAKAASQVIGLTLGVSTEYVLYPGDVAFFGSFELQI